MKLLRNKIKLLIALAVFLCHPIMPVGEPFTPAQRQQEFERQMYARKSLFWKVFDSNVTLGAVHVGGHAC